MEAKELRIGNLIQHVTGNLIVVNKLHSGEFSDPHAYSSDGDSVYDFEINNIISAAFKPIPLTEEWLIKFGFETNGVSFNIKFNGFRFILFNVGANIDFNRSGYSVTLHQHGDLVQIARIQHVHQLQNLYFALTGEELTLKD